MDTVCPQWTHALWHEWTGVSSCYGAVVTRDHAVQTFDSLAKK